MLTEEEILHIADLSGLELSETDIVKYQKEIRMLMDEIDKILSLEITEEELLINPIKQEALLRSDNPRYIVPKEEVFNGFNAKNEENYIEVAGALND